MKKISLLALFLLGSMSYNTTFAQERVVTRGIEVAINGYMPEVGVMAPDFSATDKDMNEVNLSSFRGKRVVLNIFPSLDTPTCALSVKQFNAEAASLENTVVLQGFAFCTVKILFCRRIGEGYSTVCIPQ